MQFYFILETYHDNADVDYDKNDDHDDDIVMLNSFTTLKAAFTNRFC